MEIRKAVAGDIDAIAAFFDAVNDHLATHINYPGWKKGIYPARQDAQRGVADGSLFVATVDGEIAATVVLRHQREVEYDQADWHCHLEKDAIFVIHTFAVLPRLLGQGVGRALMDFVLEYSASMGIKALRLDVYKDNTPAIRLYESMGFQYIDTIDLGAGRYGYIWYRLYQCLL